MKAFWILVLSLLFNSAFAQKSMLNDTKTYEIINKGIEKTYNCEFDKAIVFYEEVKKLYPNHPAYPFLMAANLYWEMAYNDSYKEKADNYFSYLESSLKLATDLLTKNANDVEGIFFTMATESSMALYYAEREENMKCIGHVKKAYGSMKEGFKLKNKFTDFYLSTGLYDYYEIQYPESHPVFKPFMFVFVKGDKKRGIEELEYVSKNGIFSKVEGLHYLANIFLKYESDPKRAATYTQQLVERFPKNNYFVSRHVEALIGSGRYKEAEYYSYKLYYSSQKTSQMRAYVFYGMLNELYFKKPDESIRYYNAAIKLAQSLSQPSGDYFAYSYAGLGRIYFQKGNTAKAVECYKKVKEYAEITSVIQEADKFLEEND